MRITHGYEPKIPLIHSIYTKYLQWLDTHSDAFNTAQINAGRIPVVSHVILQMQSDAIEPGNPVSLPGPGNNGQPTDPGDPPVVTSAPPDCLTIGCTVGNTPVVPPCDPSTDANGCRPSGCQQGDSSCDPGCGNDYCCLQRQQQASSAPTNNLPSISGPTR